jgi:hypothetical protein
MVLTGTKLTDRIVAARRLRGWDQAKFNQQLAERGWGVQDAGRIERGDKPLKAPMVPALAEALCVPERWFTDDELDLTAPAAPSMRTDVQRIERRLDRVLASQDAVIRLLLAALPKDSTLQAEIRAALERAVQPQSQGSFVGAPASDAN